MTRVHGYLAVLATAVAIAPRGGAGQNVSAVRSVWVDGGSPVHFAQASVRHRGTLFGMEARAAGSVWLDTAYPKSSLVNADELTLDRVWGSLELRFGVGDLGWGLSDVRSPVAVLVPRGVVWNSWGGPALSRPLVSLVLSRSWGSAELVVLPGRRPFALGRLVTQTWGDLRIRSDEGWRGGSDLGLRWWWISREVDFALSYAEGRDRRPWVRRTDPGRAEIFHPRISQLGYEIQWARGAAVLRSEGGVTRRDGSWHRRGLVGVEWFATPYATVLLEQGLASDRTELPSPILDDLMVSGRLLTETLRLEGSLFVDPRSGNRHHSLAVRWNAGDFTSLEAEVWGGAHDPSSEPGVAIRQPRTIQVAVVRFF